MEQSNALSLYISSAPHCQSICVITHSHLHRASHSSIHQASLKASKDNMALLTIYGIYDTAKHVKISFYTNAALGGNIKSLQLLFTSLQARSPWEREHNGCSFVASVLNICQYQLSVLLSDTLQMFKVRLETPWGWGSRIRCLHSQKTVESMTQSQTKRGQSASLL